VLEYALEQEGREKMVDVNARRLAKLTGDMPEIEAEKKTLESRLKELAQENTEVCSLSLSA
tara:strand:- start:479 stop:661 length:183 start_codon:yes stop_codon:yes gene_type:complete